MDFGPVLTMAIEKICSFFNIIHQFFILILLVNLPFFIFAHSCLFSTINCASTQKNGSFGPNYRHAILLIINLKGLVRFSVLN